jgi:hypothetical protein
MGLSLLQFVTSNRLSTQYTNILFLSCVELLPRATNSRHGDTVIMNFRIPLLDGKIKAEVLRTNSVIKVEVCTIVTYKTITFCQ